MTDAVFRSALIAAGLCAFACSKGGSAAPAVAADVAEAGDVRELSGTVTAHKGSAAPRALAVGDVVSGNDVIETGADGSVVIELRHNGVRWSLGANQSKQVSQSAAWQAPRAGSEVAAVSDDRDTAAGRHAERSAADTAESAVAAHGDTESDKAPPSTAAVGLRPDTAAKKPPPRAPEQHASTHAEKASKGNAPPPPDLQPTGSGPFDDTMSANLNDSSGGGGGGGSVSGGGSIGAMGTGSGSGASPPPSGDVSLTVDGDTQGNVVKTIHAKYLAGFTRCYKNELKQDPTAAGKVTITFTVATDGTVKSVSVDAGGSLAGVRDCVGSVMRGAKLDAQSDETEYSLVLKFEPS